MSELLDALRARGVVVHCPEATVLHNLDPDRFEAGVEIFPGCTVSGRESLFGAGTELGAAGGGSFHNVRTGRDVSLHSGYFDDAVFLDGVTIRGFAEVRGGTLLEEGCEAAHNVGYKMTVMLPFVVAGSGINFCDALFAGGTSRSDHSEIGSCLALYNYTPWGDKFASWFGDVPRGVFLRSPRVFVGGQTQVVSPVHVGYGAVIPAGCAVRRSVPEGRLYGERMPPTDMPFDPALYGGLTPKFALTAEYIGNLRALEVWYEHVRHPAARDAHETALYDAALVQIRAGIAERIKRLQKIVDKLPSSRARHEAATADAPAKVVALHEKRIAEHDAIVAGWPDARSRLEAAPNVLPFSGALAELAVSMVGETGWTERLGGLDVGLVARGAAALQSCVDHYRTSIG